LLGRRSIRRSALWGWSFLVRWSLAAVATPQHAFGVPPLGELAVSDRRGGVRSGALFAPGGELGLPGLAQSGRESLPDRLVLGLQPCDLVVCAGQPGLEQGNVARSAVLRLTCGAGAVVRRWRISASRSPWLQM